MRSFIVALLFIIACLVSAVLAQQPAQEQVDPMAYIRALQAQRDRALSDQALAEARLAKAQADLAELRKKLESKPEAEADKH